MKVRKSTKKIIWHCTATPEGREVTKAELRKWHVDERGWSDIGYHYLIQLTGNIIPCRDEKYIGAHCKGQNSDSIGIAYSGGLTDDGSLRAKDTRTAEQTEAMYRLTEGLLDKYELTWDDVYGHNHFSAKACPSFDVQKDIALKKENFEPGDIEPDMPDLGATGLVLEDLEKRVKTIEAWMRAGHKIAE